MNWNAIKAMVLGILGLTTFEEKEGKPSLTEEQRKTLKTVYGKTFLDQFETDLAKSEEKISAEDTNALVSAITAHNTMQQAENVRLFGEMRTSLENTRTALKTAQDQITRLSESPEVDVLPEISENFPRKEGVAAVVRPGDLRSSAYTAVSFYVTKGYFNAALAQTIDVGDLREEFGVYLSQSQNNLSWVKTVSQDFSSAKFFTSKMATTQYRALQSLITSVSQQFNMVWTPGGKVKMRPLMIQNYRHKINVPIVPAEVLDSYAMALYDEGLAPDQMPITRYIIREKIMKQLLQDIELRMIFKGKYVDHGTPEPGSAASAPEDSMQGVETIIAEGKVNGDKINYFPGYDDFDYVTATDAEVLKFVADFVDWIAPLFQLMKMPIFCSLEFYRRYKRAYKNIWKYAQNTDDPMFGKDQIDFAMQYLQVAAGQYGSPIIWCTPPENLVKLRHRNEVPQIINDVQKHDYEVRVYGEYWLGTGFEYAEAVFAFCPDEYNPKALVTQIHRPHTDYQQFQLGAGYGSASAGGGL